MTSWIADSSIGDHSVHLLAATGNTIHVRLRNCGSAINKKRVGLSFNHADLILRVGCKGHIPVLIDPISCFIIKGSENTNESGAKPCLDKVWDIRSRVVYLQKVWGHRRRPSSRLRPILCHDQEKMLTLYYCHLSTTLSVFVRIDLRIVKSIFSACPAQNTFATTYSSQELVEIDQDCRKQIGIPGQLR